MRTIQVMSILALGLWFSAPAVAAPWCAFDSLGGENCGFQSYEQCRRSIQGTGGSCQRNQREPAGKAQPAPAREPRAARQSGPSGGWCAHDSRGGVNCGFRTYEQCRRNIAGLGGSCQRNLQ